MLNSKRKNRIKLSVKDITYKDNVIFLMEIENKSIIDYDVNFLSFFISDKASTRKRSSQSLQIKPFYTYSLTNKINGNSKCEFVLIFSKFTLANNNKMVVELNEMYWERNLSLQITWSIDY